jgi:DNA-3-methyladenine glycosylase
MIYPNYMLLPDLSSSLIGAQSLLGWELVHHTPAGSIGGIIIETEAYHEDDEASHSFRGRTTRTAPMFESAGHIYMYFIYGMHWCINIVAGPKSRGEAVLIRALYPTLGTDFMKSYRKIEDKSHLTDGPGKLVQALAIPPTYSGLKIDQTSLELIPPSKVIKNIKTSPRVGIKKAVDKPWRFYIDWPGSS